MCPRYRANTLARLGCASSGGHGEARCSLVFERNYLCICQVAASLCKKETALHAGARADSFSALSATDSIRRLMASASAAPPCAQRQTP